MISFSRRDMAIVVISDQWQNYTDHGSQITLRSNVRRSSIQVALQNHLSCHLVDIASGFPRFLACLTQCALGSDGRQALVPRNNRAWQNSAQFFYKPKDFSRGRSDLAIHPAGNTGYDMIDVSFADDLRHTRRRLFACWNGFKRMRQEL